LSGGKLREFAFTKLKTFDHVAWETLVVQAKKRVKTGTLLPIFGTDKYGYAITDARENLTANGLLEFVHLKQVSILEVSAPATSGVLVTNPPYGERLGDTTDLADLYPKLGDWLKQKFAGWRAYFFTGDPQLAKGVRLSAGSNRKAAPASGG
jgi:putative N6-adenine-specific DNA methylase